MGIVNDLETLDDLLATAQRAEAVAAADRRFDEIVGPNEEIVRAEEEQKAAPPAPKLGLPAIEDSEPHADDLRLWSVTTVIGTLEKSGLVYWSAQETAIAAIRSQSSWQGLLADDDPECEHKTTKCEVVKWLADARFRRPKGYRSATELGTAVHDAVERYALSGVRPEVDVEVRPFLDQFDRWAQAFSPSYQATEVAVYHPTHGYAGTADAFLTIDGVRYIADYKTTRNSVDSKGKPSKPYPSEVGLQLSAYRHAEKAAVWRPRRHEKYRRRYYLLSPAEQAMAEPVPEVDTGLVIHIAPEHCDAFPIRCDDEVFESYLAVQDAARWVLALSRRAMSDPLVPTGG